MRKRKQIKYLHEGEYVAAVDVELLMAEDEWAPYLSLEDAYKLDDVSEALRRADFEAASKKARVFILQPIAIWWFSVVRLSVSVIGLGKANVSC